ncbi:MAG: aminotransferase class V-fold PLP-dependent enzyme [Leptospiraceae bacterium]|nr:aminotransferase class V-fold PLP-dependent enzyme [Leptospiraceae bacterium]MDW8305808.1 aminotransferase class V-fold PLP-dependent enzyme [Leptospiraceae bacterium]
MLTTTQEKTHSASRVQHLRSYYPFFSHNPNTIYLDSAATALKPKPVLDAILDYYETKSVNIHRGVYSLSAQATEIYESTRQVIRNFLHAPENWEIIYTRGTTTSINLLAYSLLRVKKELAPFFSAWHTPLGKGDIIVLSESEHHSNIVPWQIITELTQSHIYFLPVRKNGTLDDSPLAGELKNLPVKIISLAAVSNVSGVVHDLKNFIEFAKNKGAIFIVDAAQAVCHGGFSLRDNPADFVAFSGHKIGGPTAIGILAGRKDVLSVLPPFEGGGDMILQVTKEKTTYNEPPHRFEAGTPPIGEVFGLRAAVEFLTLPLCREIMAQESELTTMAMEIIQELGGTLYGPSLDEVNSAKVKKAGIIAFNLGKIHPNDVGTLLDEQNICIRTGHHCCQLLMQAWQISATARVSLFLYNTKEELLLLKEALRQILRLFGKKIQ